MKFFVIGFVFFTCVYISRIFSKSLKDRIVVLNAFYRDITMFKDLAITQGKDISSIFELLADENEYLYEIYINVSFRAKNRPNLSIAKLWIDTIDECGILSANAKDLELIRDFSNVLLTLKNIGGADIIGKYLSDLSIYISENKKEITDKASLFEKFGYVAGVFFGILLV